MAIVIALKSKSSINSWNETGSWVTLSASTPVFLTFFFTYVYKSFKENAPCREFIKPTRLKYFQSGLLTTFILFSCYLFLWVVAYKVQSDTPMYVALGLVMLFGLVTIAYLSLYEFCISFDVLYSKNKEQLVHNFLERVSGKKLKIISD